jgi:zinc transporter ZupT
MGALLGQSLLGVLGPLGQDLLMALAAGTFLFVCLCELLGEVFHHKDDIWAKLGLLGVGVGLMVLTQSLEAGLG